MRGTPHQKEIIQNKRIKLRDISRNIYIFLGKPNYLDSCFFSPSTKKQDMDKMRTARACSNCKLAHTACDVNRPCGRCISLGKEDSCFDVERKKRGRPKNSHAQMRNTKFNLGAYPALPE